MIGFAIYKSFQIIGRALVFEIEVFFDVFLSDYSQCLLIEYPSVILNDYTSVILNASEESCCKILRCRSG